MNDATRSFVRRQWFSDVARECQLFAGRAVTACGRDTLSGLTSDLIRTLPDAETPAEDLALRGLLVTTAAKWAVSAHAALHADPAVDCDFVPTLTLRGLFDGSDRRAKDDFSRWADGFWTDLERAHPPSALERAVHLIQSGYHEHGDCAHLARAVGASAAGLRKLFEAEFGVSVAEYVRRTRLLTALEQLVPCDAKVEAVALGVGYRSKTNFYRAFKRAVGMTPSAFRALPPGQACELLEQLRASIGATRGRLCVNTT